MHGEMTPTSIVASMVISTLFKWIGVVARASMAMLALNLALGTVILSAHD